MKYICVFLCFFVVLLWGCGKVYDEEKTSDLDYTIVTEEEMSQQVREIVESSKEESFRKTYSDKDYLYIIVGYGAQPTSSYSIEIQELYESSNAIYISTMLKGPERSETVLEVETYPYVVVKVLYQDKDVIFQ
ncbi:MAG: protease complex subunit PrcB family protein [Lachnospiraceae bacterium]|nr:protease complex subunit PrcB family protein [Lachnospiraceae bacterium]